MRQDEAARTLGYWFDVEALAARDAEKRGAVGNGDFVTHVFDGAMPWHPSFRPLSKAPGKHVHFVRFGIVPKVAYDAELLALLNTAPADEPDRPTAPPTGAFAFLGSFRVGADGLPRLGSLATAAFATAFASLRSGRQVDYGRYHQDLSAFLDAKAAHLAEDGGAVDQRTLGEIVDHAASLLGWRPKGTEAAPSAIIVSKKVVVRRHRDGTVSEEEPDDIPLNGFYAEDIGRAAGLLASGGSAGLVGRYVATPDEEARVDVSSDVAVEGALDTACLPDGRWPSEHPLTLMQQVAVSQGMAALAGGGTFSVNGPPGTGKTTLLMDVVAAVIVERAKVLASFRQPRDAFSPGWQVKYPNTANPATVHRLDARLLDFTMVVASSNNGAVENVTRELPSLAKVAPAWRDALRYFPATAAELLRPMPDDAGDAGEQLDGGVVAQATVNSEPWGLVSAALGKVSNRKAFLAALKARNADGTDHPANLAAQLKDRAAALSWSEAVRRFEVALAAVRRCKGRVVSAERLAAEALRLESEAATLRGDAAAAKGRHAAAVEEERGCALSAAAARDAYVAADRTAGLVRPGGLVSFLALVPGFAAARASVSAFESAMARRAEAGRRVEEEKAALGGATRRLASAAADVAGIGDRLAGTVAAIERNRTAVADASVRMRGHLPRTAIRGMSDEARQQVLPGTSDELSDARATLFVAAMDLHRSFVSSAGSAFESNLRRAMGMLERDVYLSACEPGWGAHLWATLSLVVPVISTTFASMARCFEHMPPGGIGWLFVDEAGQAVPQHAVGAMMRSKRAMVIGDPLQITPVTTLDRNVDRKMMERHGADLRHQSTATSMQEIADGISRYGTHREGVGGGPQWIGSPLRVHRRCVEPMFGIANDIAYGGRMVLGSGMAEREAAATIGDRGRRRPARPLLGPSCWIDVRGNEGAEAHYIPAQGEAACLVLRSFLENGWTGAGRVDGLPDLFVISPFKSVANGLRRVLATELERSAPMVSARAAQDWLTSSVGTVHTFQGKESESVLFVLGGSSKGAIGMMASTPNVVNVAVTRAKRRLYVVGDRSVWSRFPLVASSLDARLPRTPPCFSRHLAPPTSGGGRTGNDDGQRDRARGGRALLGGQRPVGGR